MTATLALVRTELTLLRRNATAWTTAVAIPLVLGQAGLDVNDHVEHLGMARAHPILEFTLKPLRLVGARPFALSFEVTKRPDVSLVGGPRLLKGHQEPVAPLVPRLIQRLRQRLEVQPFTLDESRVQVIRQLVDDANVRPGAGRVAEVEQLVAVGEIEEALAQLLDRESGGRLLRCQPIHLRMPIASCSAVARSPGGAWAASVAGPVGPEEARATRDNRWSVKDASWASVPAAAPFPRARVNCVCCLEQPLTRGGRGPFFYTCFSLQLN
jgi:hypothetical protein